MFFVVLGVSEVLGFKKKTCLHYFRFILGLGLRLLIGLIGGLCTPWFSDFTRNAKPAVTLQSQWT